MDSIKLVAMEVLVYPFELCTSLVQIGYMPPSLNYLDMGEQGMYRWPSLPEYMKALFEEEGLLGFTRGMLSKLLSHFLKRVLINKAEEIIMKYFFNEEDSMLNVLKSSVVIHGIGVTVTHPLDLIGTRQIAQFVGKEKKYSGIFLTPFMEVYKENGICGFFAGLAPRFIGEIVFYSTLDLVAWNLDRYIANVQQLDASEEHLMMHNVVLNHESIIPILLKYSSIYIVSSLSNPFFIVTKVMETSKSGIEAGEPPFMPEYVSWIECLIKMYKENHLRRRLGVIQTFRGYPFSTLPSKAL